MARVTIGTLVDKALPILRRTARERNVITYGRLATLIGTHPRTIGRVLDRIWNDEVVDRDIVALVVHVDDPGRYEGWASAKAKTAARLRALRVHHGK